MKRRGMRSKHSLLGVQWRFLRPEESRSRASVASRTFASRAALRAFSPRSTLRAEVEDRAEKEVLSYVLGDGDASDVGPPPGRLDLSGDAEDDELARAMAAVSPRSSRTDRTRRASPISDGEGEIDEEKRRSPSPVIIWRPSARVKLATDVPPELLEDVDEEYMLSQLSTYSSTMLPPPSCSMLAPAGAEVASGRSPWETVASRPSATTGGPTVPKKKKKKARPSYGAWYMPVDKWRVKRSDEDDGSGAHGGHDGSAKSAGAAGGSGGGDGVLHRGRTGGKVEAVQREVEQLRIAAQFKAYMQREGMRLPKFLERVEVAEDVAAHAAGSSAADVRM